MGHRLRFARTCSGGHFIQSDPTKALRTHLLDLLRGGGAHLHFDKAVADLPAGLRRPAGVPHTPWRLVEHMRIAQWDILEFRRNPKHVSPSFPEGYWPNSDAPPDADAWDRTLAAFRADLQAMQDLVADPATDLFAPIRTARARPSFARLCSWRTITPTIWESWWWCDGCWGRGRNKGRLARP